MAAIHISISAEPIFHLGNFEISNSMLVGLLVSIFLVTLAFRFYKTHQTHPNSKSNLFLQTIVEAIYGFVQSVTPHQAGKFFPLIATIFLFIIIGSWAGLLPGAETIGITRMIHGEKIFVPLIKGATADLNTTLAIALVAVLSIQFYGYQSQGTSYFKKFINLTNPINFFVGLLEIISEFSRIISFSFRLFGNIFAGEVLLIVMASLVPLFAPLPFIGLEIFVGFIQALVFAMLTLVFINIAISKHH